MSVQHFLGAVSIRKTVLPGMAIPMLKIRRPNGRLIFNMGIPIPGKDGLYIETGPGSQVLIFRANFAHTLVEVDDDGLFPSVIMSWSVTILAMWHMLMHVFKVEYLCNSWQKKQHLTQQMKSHWWNTWGNYRFYFTCWWHALSDPLSSRKEKHRISTHCLAVWIYWNNFLAKIEMTFYELLYWT